MSSTKAKAALKQAKELISKGDFKYVIQCEIMKLTMTIIINFKRETHV